MILFLYYYHESTCMIVMKQNYNTCCAFMWIGTRFWESYQTFHQFLKIFFFQSLCYVKLFRLVHLTMYFMQLQMSECCIHLSINHRFNQYNMFCVGFFSLHYLLCYNGHQYSPQRWLGGDLSCVMGASPIMGGDSVLWWNSSCILEGDSSCIMGGYLSCIILCHGRRLIPYHGRRFCVVVESLEFVGANFDGLLKFYSFVGT